MPRRVWLSRAAGGLLGLFLPGCIGGRPRQSGADTRFEFERPQMGVPFRMVICGQDRAVAAAAAESAFARVEALNRALSDYDPDSEVSRLCLGAKVGVASPVGEDLWRMLVQGLALARATGGAFDVTLGPLVNLWRRARRRGELPADHLLAEARMRCGWERLQLDARKRTVTFLAAGMRLDFGGMAKGYAADEAMRVLRESGFRRTLVAAAGDIVVADPPPGQAGWTVEVGGSDLPGSPAARRIPLRRSAVSTSGDLFQRLEIGGRRYSHIVDPRTGIGLTDRALVTVLARDGTTSDSVSTAVSVLGMERGLRWADTLPGVAVQVIRLGEGGAVEVGVNRRWTAGVGGSKPVEGAPLSLSAAGAVEPACG